MSAPIHIAAFYKFVPLQGLALLRSSILGRARRDELWGTVLLADEGINANVAGTPDNLQDFLGWLSGDPNFADLSVTFTEATEIPFYRLKVRIRNEIVTMGVDGVDPHQLTGHHVSPQDWNQLIQDPDVVLFDARNDYEVAMGTFKGAENPNTEAFRQWPSYVSTRIGGDKSKKVAMFCTGGIRCEKASALLRQKGFDEVYQLQGGILNYLKQVPEAQSRWRGDCFVFDERVAVNHRLQPSHYELCRGCRYPITEQDKKTPSFEQGVSCPRCAESQSAEQRQAFRERQRQVELAAQRGYAHLGKLVKR